MKKNIICTALCVAFLFGAWDKTVFGQTAVPKSSTKQAVTAPKAATTQTVAAPTAATNQPVDKRVNLTDPEGKIIGYIDPKTGDLIFPSLHLRIPHAMIKQVSKEQFLAMKKAHGLGTPTLKMAQPPAQEETIHAPNQTTVIVDGIDMTGSNIPGSSVGGGGTTTTNVKSCVTMCWHIQEGSIYCEGFATDEGHGICTVWEYCSDTQSSGPLK